MNAKQFEAAVVKTWVETNIPLTRANLMAVTGEARADVEHHMRGLLRQGVVDMDVANDGEIEWKVRGAKRPRAAPDTVGDVKEKQQATQNLAEAKAVIAVAGKSAIKALEPGPGQKGVLLSAGLSLLFGPFGWFYAGAIKEAIPAILVYVALVALAPKFLTGTLLGLLHPACGVIGFMYAWKYNQLRRRVPLLFKDSPPELEAKSGGDGAPD